MRSFFWLVDVCECVVAVNEFSCVDNNKYCNNGIWPSESRNRNNTKKEAPKQQQKKKKSASINSVSLATSSTCIFFARMQIKRFSLDSFGLVSMRASNTIFRHKSNNRTEKEPTTKKKTTFIGIFPLPKIYLPWANFVLDSVLFVFFFFLFLRCAVAFILFVSSVHNMHCICAHANFLLF